MSAARYAKCFLRSHLIAFLREIFKRAIQQSFTFAAAIPTVLFKQALMLIAVARIKLHTA